MLRVLPKKFEPALQQIRLQSFFFFVDSKTRNLTIALQLVSGFLLPVLPYLEAIRQLTSF